MKGAKFGCGQCLPCRLNRRRIWVHRMMLEAALHPASSFLTLTYDKEHLNGEGTLVPRDLQLWLKRYRKSAGRCRYFAVGEYGTLSMRPHYHLAIFGHDRHFCGAIAKETWDAGYSYAGDLTLHSAQYIAGYVTKKMTGENDARLGGKYPEFARMSLRPGIGAPAIPTLVQALSTKSGWDGINTKGDVPQVLRHGSKTMPLGRYMRSVLRGALDFQFVEENPDAAFKRTAELYTLYQNYLLAEETPLTISAWQKAMEEQKIVVMEKRFAIKRSGTL